MAHEKLQARMMTATAERDQFSVNEDRWLAVRVRGVYSDGEFVRVARDIEPADILKRMCVVKANSDVGDSRGAVPTNSRAASLFAGHPGAGVHHRKRR